jgi:hypothetical protein
MKAKKNKNRIASTETLIGEAQRDGGLLHGKEKQGAGDCVKWKWGNQRRIPKRRRIVQKVQESIEEQMSDI